MVKRHPHFSLLLLSMLYAVCAMEKSSEGAYISWDQSRLVGVAKSLASKRGLVDTSHLHLSSLEYQWKGKTSFFRHTWACGSLVSTRFFKEMRDLGECCVERELFLLEFDVSSDINEDLRMSEQRSHTIFVVALPANGDTAGARMEMVTIAGSGSCMCPERPRIMVPGRYPFLGLGSDTLRGWFVLARIGERYALDTGTAIVHENPDRETGYTSIACVAGANAQIRNAILLLKSKSLAKGDVKYVYTNGPPKLERGDPTDTTLSFNGQQYQVRVTDDSKRVAVEVACQSVKQTLFSVQYLTPVSPRLIWIGDLDNDGRLDFLCDVSTAGERREFALFSSSRRTDGLVGEDAIFPARR